jgi:diguanylate cyclase (GGDEF)-like protein
VAFRRLNMTIKLIIISDNCAYSDLVNTQLTHLDGTLEVTMVTSLNHLRKAIASQPYDLIISQQVLNNFSARDVLLIVNAFDINVPVILLIESDQEALALTSMDNGAVDYIFIDRPDRLLPAVRREMTQLSLKREKQVAIKHLNYLAYHDPLSGLLNRYRMEEILNSAINFAQRAHLQYARDFLLYLDLDQFKVINDVCGHVAGDEVLKQIGQLIDKNLPVGAKAAHVNADVFAIFLPNSLMQMAIDLSEVVINLVSEYQYDYGIAKFKLGISIGIMPITCEIKDASHLLSLTDMACGTAKESGRNQWHMSAVNDEHTSRKHQQMARVSQIQKALEDDRFELWVQPIVHVAPQHKNKASNFEFLVRMIDEEGHLIAPGHFVPAAEKFKIANLLDQWVIREAIRITSQVDKQPEQQFFINLAGTTLAERSLPGFIQSCLQRFKLDPKHLCFEITETAAVTNYQRTLDFIHHIRGLGCSVALDDFGSGMSSFNYLRKFPVDYMKVDGQFVLNMLNNSLDHTIVDAFNKIGHETGLKTVAEFVENDQLLEELGNIGLDFAQGYGICPPINAIEYFKLNTLNQTYVDVEVNENV